jgi:hypothetical protein
VRRRSIDRLAVQWLRRKARDDREAEAGGLRRRRSRIVVATSTDEGSWKLQRGLPQRWNRRWVPKSAVRHFFFIMFLDIGVC